MSPHLVAQLRRWRHDLHRIPETGLAEHRTGDYLAAALTGMGLEVTRGVGGTGLVATVRGEAGDRAIALRADMDGLPLTEQPGRVHGSQHDGAMHACGHDGHMAMVLGAGHALAAEGGFAGAVHLIFQPAEEPGLGAQAMLDDGLFDRFPAEAVFGLHNLPGLPAGWIATRPGPIMAAEDDFVIRVDGRGGHASSPHMVVDPVVVAAQIVLALQTVVARNLDPAEPGVVSCTEITTDGARNAIPGTAVIRGDTRSFTPSARALIERRLREIATGIATAHGATAHVSYTHEFAPTVNDQRAVEQVVVAARLAVGADRVVPDTAPITASEDFGLLARAVPGCFAFLGNGTAPGAGGTPLHSSDYDFNDDVLATGVSFYTHLARTVLAPTTQPVSGS